MAHVMELAPTGRSQCRGCRRKIERGELRFGERRDNAFGDGELTLWFHPLCAAYSRPEPLLEFMATQPVESADDLRAIAERGIAHPRLSQLSAAERSPTDRARCRHCHKKIEKNAWRLVLVSFEEFRFNAAGFIHAGCVGEYFGTTDVMERVKHHSHELSVGDLQTLQDAITRTG